MLPFSIDSINILVAHLGDELQLTSGEESSTGPFNNMPLFRTKNAAMQTITDRCIAKGAAECTCFLLPLILHKDLAMPSEVAGMLVGVYIRRSLHFALLQL